MEGSKSGRPGCSVPLCGKKTRTQVREHTVLEDFPLFCPKCKFQGVIAFRQGKIQQLTPLQKG